MFPEVASAVGARPPESRANTGSRPLGRRRGKVGGKLTEYGPCWPHYHLNVLCEFKNIRIERKEEFESILFPLFLLAEDIRMLIFIFLPFQNNRLTHTLVTDTVSSVSSYSFIQSVSSSVMDSPKSVGCLTPAEQKGFRIERAKCFLVPDPILSWPGQGAHAPCPEQTPHPSIVAPATQFLILLQPTLHSDRTRTAHPPWLTQGLMDIRHF